MFKSAMILLSIAVVFSSAAAAVATPIAVRNSVEMIETGAVSVPENGGLFAERSILTAVTQLMGRLGPGARHVINVIEIHKDAWVSHLTAPAEPKCAAVQPFFPKGVIKKPPFNVLDTLARSVPGLMLDWISANQLTQKKQVFREFYALNANYFNFPDPESFKERKYDNRKGVAPESCVRPAGPYGDPAKVLLENQFARMDDVIDDAFPVSPLILFNDGTGLKLSGFHRNAPPDDRGAQWQADYVSAAHASRGGAVVSGISLLHPGGKIPDVTSLGTNGDKPIPRIALAWNGTHKDYPLAIISWHIALSKPLGKDEKLAIGPTLPELANVVKALGYREALNLDGSGSSQLIYGGVESVVSKGPRAMIPLNIDNKYTYAIDQATFVAPFSVSDPTAIDSKTFAIPRPVPNGLLFYELQQK